MIRNANVILVDRATADQLNAVHEIVKTHASGWWHHFTSVWIVGGEKTATQWRNLISPVITEGAANVLVLELPPPEADRLWAFYGKKPEERSKWLHDSYK